MMGAAKPITDHEHIRRWVEERGGKPAHVRGTDINGDPGVLRIDFPGYGSKEKLDALSWDVFFEWFERNHLALIVQDEEGSRFNRLVSRESVADQL